ncbi:MASE1 domain-containing protein [Ramlibacter ginsenosidimutans]|uniref:histidine kinase n=1 Tax=Ramlibacter ginsenosidimutans TaxID=502333 RepID=A0A934WQJ3_9BURK|nr:MASE1 domain-containing protein [Ramlibacter ginsenosidimutans]MBK6009305.1 MASE1 domain-containing protein [Ramlibacter ginsenosidimutans]
MQFLRPSSHQHLPGSSAADPAGSLLRVAALVGLGYYAGARVGATVAFSEVRLSMLWLPTAVLMAALLLTPRRWWWAAFAGALPAHLMFQLHAGIALPVVLGTFVSNGIEALLAALLVTRWSPAPGFRTLRSVVAFCTAAVVAPLVSALISAAFLRLAEWNHGDFAALWRMLFFSHVLAALTLVPVLVSWSALEPMQLRQGRAHLLEIGLLVSGLFAVGLIVFDSSSGSLRTGPALLYLPLPFLLWAALRFGPALTSAAYAVVAFLVIWGAAHGRGPFEVPGFAPDALAIQLFLVSIVVPLLMLAAVIEERRDGERKLRASEELFSTAFRRGPDAMAIARQHDGSILEANARWLQLLGYPGDTAVVAPQPLAAHLDEASRRRMEAASGDTAAPQEFEIQLRDRAGGAHAALASTAAVEVGGQACQILLLRDITEQRVAERDAQDQRRQLTHLTRVASLSDFSSTIAHELNQPLTAILANAQAAVRLLQLDPSNVEEIRTILDEIADADKRAGLLIHHLRLLMKKGNEEFVQVDLNHLVQDVLDFIRGEFLVRGVELKTSYARDLPQVHGDRVQLQQVVLNLVVNACDAMQDMRKPRVLSVGTSQTAEGLVQVSVSDTGNGIAPEQIERIFEPFYTTKEKGLGMGLAICRRIAGAHGGTLSAQSRTGEGAVFKLALPAVVPAGSAGSAGVRQVAGAG